MSTRGHYAKGERVRWGKCTGTILSRYSNPLAHSYLVKLTSGQRVEVRFADLRPDTDET